MADIFSALFNFPTGIFTVLLAAVVLYWLLVILGALDIEILDFNLDSSGDSLEGTADGDIESATAHAGSGWGGFLAALGLSGVPTTIALSLLVLWAWLLSASGSELLNTLSVVGPLRTALASLLLVLSLIISVALTILMVRPLKRFFDPVEAPRREALVGRICTITTLRVDEDFGQAEYDDGGAGLLIQVRARRNDTFSKGEKALIISYNDKKGAYHVMPYDDAIESKLLQS